MDTDPENISQDLPQSTVLGSTNGGSIVGHPDLLEACALCRRILSPENEAIGGVEPVGICGDCKFLFLEDLGTPIQDYSNRRRHRRGRRSRYSSSESIDDLFSQQFSHTINLVRQNQSTVSEHEGRTDGDASGRFLLHRTSSQTPPSGSRRWRRVLTDTESDGGFDYLESLYGDTESNASFDGYRVFAGESDAVSVSAYGGDSDASVDGRGFLDTEIFAQPDNESYIDSDTDIDPMRAGLDQWNSDDDQEDQEWEEDDAEENMGESIVEAELRNILISSPNDGANDPASLFSFRWRGHRDIRSHNRRVFTNLDRTEVQPYIGNSGDYLDARGFEELLEHLAEAESSIRGAPPAAVSFVKSLPRVVISEEHDRHSGSACAICKDFLSVGTEVNQLPCFHLYHPSCILPWLNSRNSCPLCRYELPTDDKDYELGKRDTSRVREVIEEHDTSEDESSDDVADEVEADETRDSSSGEQQQLVSVDDTTNDSGSRGGRRGWFFLAAAAPIVSIVGIVLVLWLGNPLVEGRGRAPHPNQVHSTASCPPNQRGETRSRRWWSLF